MCMTENSSHYGIKQMYFFSLLLALFCDYYNSDGECEWHYEPCGKSCMKTCRNPSGKCYNIIPALEGKEFPYVLICFFL